MKRVISNLTGGLSLCVIRYATMFILMMVVGVNGVKGQTHPFTLTTADDITNGTQKYYLIQSIERPSFYAIPHSNSDGSKVSTTSIPNANMRWCFVDAGSDNDHQYYYIVNFTGRCLYRNSNNNDGILIKKTYADLSSLSDAELNKYKFYLTQTESDYFIQPKGFSGEYLNKRAGNVRYEGNYYIKSSTYNDAPSVWNFVAVGSVTWTQPFTVSTNSEKHFYKFKNVNNTSFFLSNSGEWATVSRAGGDEDIWYFLEAGVDATYSNFHYYYIVNAATEKYLYYTGDTGNDVAKVLDFNSAENDKYCFLIVDAAYKPDNTNFATGYTIVPKLRQTFFYDKDSYAPMAMSDDSHLLLKSDRVTSGNTFNYDSHWTFETVWAEPVVTCDENGTITITQSEGADVRYTISNSTTPPATPTSSDALYTNNLTAGTGLTIIKARAIAAGKSPSRVITQKIVYLPNQTFTSSTYNGTTQVPDVIIGETTIDPEEYNISYQKGGTDVTECMDAGTYTVTITDKDGGEYIVYGSGSFTINKKALTIAAEAKSKTYGDADPALTYTSEGLIEGDAITGALSRAEGQVVGDYAITQGTLTAGDNYIITYTGANLTINKKALTITADSDSKEYDGEELIKNSYTHTDLATGDVITSVTITGSQTDKGSSDNVPSAAVIKNNNGEGDDVTGCYNITYVNGTLSVTGRVITITADSDEKVYDGTALTKNSYTYDGTLFSGDAIESVTITGSQTVVGSSNNVPSAAVIKNGDTNVTANYTINYVNGTLEVTKKALTITANPKTITYGNAPANDGVTYTGFVNSETETVLSGTLDYDYSYTQYGNVGNTYTITPKGLTSNNYNITFASGTLTVSQKEVGLTWQSTNLTYSGTAQTPTATATGMVNNDAITVTVTGGKTNVGTGYTAIASALSGDKAGNYKLPTDNTTTFAITAKTLTVTADAKEKTYGDADPEFTYTSEGLVGEDVITGALTREEGENIGTYAITQGTLSASENYTISYIGANLTINAITLTITAGSDEKVYDGTALTWNNYTCVGLKKGHHVESVTITGSQTNVGSSDNVPSDAVVKNGDVVVTGNYNITYVNGTLTITPKALTITAEAKEKTYGEADPALTYTSEGLINNDVITGSLTREAGENAGDYAILQGDLTAGNNYAIAYTGANLTITKVGLTITANNNTITYGDAPAGNGITCEGFVNSETASVLSGTVGYDFSYKQFDNVGNTYTITPKGLTSDNYDITFVAGTLTVVQKEVGLTWENTEFTYDGEEHAPTATVKATDLVNSDAIAVTVTGAQTNAGNHTATASALTGAKAGNYKLPTANTQSFIISSKSIGDGTTLADGYTLDFGEGNTILLTDKDIGSALVLDTDYSVSADSDNSPQYSQRTVTGKGNYTGSFDVRNVVISFTTDIDQEEWSATFAAENSDVFNIGIGLALPEGVSAFIISGIQGDWAIPEPLNYIPKGVPVLLVAHKEINGFVPTIAESGNVTPITDPQQGKNMLEVVTAESVHFNTKEIYVLFKNEFVFNKDGDMPKGKVYLNPNHTAPSSSPSPDPAPARLKIAWNYTTGIKDGRWKVDDGRSERWYTLDGRCLSGKPTTKGLYIVNGKKVVIK